MTIINILGESALRSLALALVATAALRLLRVRNAQLEKRAWTVVLVLALAMPALVALRIPRVSFTAVWAAPQVIVVPPASPMAAYRRAATVEPSQTITAPSAPALVVPAALLGAPAPQRGFPWALVGIAVYAAITALLLLRILIGLCLSARLWSRAQVYATNETHLPVRLTAELHSPATLGHGLLLPLEAVDWDAATLRSTLAHEAAHVGQGDFYLQLAASLHLAFFWISPLAWWLPTQLARLCETICDRAAVQVSGDGLCYAQLLLRMATTQRTPAGLVAMAQSAGLRERIERLIADPQLATAFRQRRGQAAGALLLLGVAGVATAATVHILQPAPTVLAAPQAPAPPAAPATPAAPSADAVNPAPSAPSAPAGPPAPASAAAVPAPAPAPDPAVAPAPAPEPAPLAAPVPEPMPAPAVAPVPPVSPVPPLNPEVGIMMDDQSGTPYAIYTGKGGTFVHGSQDAGEWSKTQAASHPGGAIWFERDGKQFIIDDPALVKQAREAYAPVEALGKRQGELGEKQGKLGDQQGGLGELQGAIGEKQGEWGAKQGELASKFQFEMPEGFDKTVNEMAESAEKLATESETLTEAQRQALEAQQKEAKATLDKMMAQFKANAPQREAWEKEMREQGEQMRKQMEPMLKQMHELAAKQGALGKQQGELAHQQMELGRQQRSASREANQKVQSLIDQAVRDGTAHPAP